MATKSKDYRYAVTSDPAQLVCSVASLISPHLEEKKGKSTRADPQRLRRDHLGLEMAVILWKYRKLTAPMLSGFPFRRKTHV
jgi:hypothetical protein